MIDATVRVEGVSDPDDEAAVFGVTCLHGGARGVLVAAYGPTASADEATVLTALRNRSDQEAATFGQSCPPTRGRPRRQGP